MSIMYFQRKFRAKKQNGKGEISYKEYIFNMEFEKDDRDLIIHVQAYQSKSDCVTVFIHEKTNTATIHNLSYYADCSKGKKLDNPGGGKILFFFIVGWLQQKKN